MESLLPVFPTRAPAKNASGAARDTPESMRAQMIAPHRRWLRWAGVTVEDSATVEICPFFAQDADELAAKVQFGLRVNDNR